MPELAKNDENVVFFDPHSKTVLEDLEELVEMAKQGGIKAFGIAFIKADGSPSAKVCGHVDNWAETHGIIGGLHTNAHFILRYAEKREGDGTI